MNKENLESLMAYVKERQRICPKPQRWNDLWAMLPGKKRRGMGWNPPAPLILAAWHCTCDDEKADRLALHIEYADHNGILNEIGTFLRSLPEEEWVHRGEA